MQPILVEYIGVWTWQEFEAATASNNANLFQGEQTPVVAIHDFSQQKAYPLDVLGRGRQVLMSNHPRIIKHIIFGVNPTVVTIFQVFLRMILPDLRDRFYVVRSHSEALKLANSLMHPPSSPTID